MFAVDIEEGSMPSQRKYLQGRFQERPRSGQAGYVLAVPSLLADLAQRGRR